MANIADCKLVKGKKGGLCMVAVTSGDPDELPGCWYSVHSEKGELVGHGFSRGTNGRGAESQRTAMRAGIANAKRYLARISK